MAADSGARSVRLIDEESNPVASLVVTDSLAAAVARAVSISHVGHGGALSFPSLLTGVLGGTDSVGAWLRAHFVSDGVDVPALLRRQTLSTEAFERLQAEAP